MPLRRLQLRRDTHQALQDQTLGPAGGDESVGLGRTDPGLLRLFTGIDLHIQSRRGARLLDLVSQGPGQAFTVKGLDDIEQGDRFASLVGLKGSDQPKFDPGAARNPAFPGFLDTVFAENPLTGRQHGVDPLIGLLLGDGDQSQIVRIAAGLTGCGGDTIQHRAAGGGDIR